MTTCIRAMHLCVPPKRLTNEDLARRFDERQLASIVKMAGIRERRVVCDGITASDLAFCAARNLLEDRRIEPGTIDLLIFASQTGDYQIPATAAVLHQRLGLEKRCAAFDINLGCTSFPYTLAVAHGLILAGIANRALLLNADALTTVIHPRDRGLVPLHGDGAVATLLERSDGPDGLVGFHLGTDGTGCRYLMIPASGARTPRTPETRAEHADESGIVRTAETLYMDGPAVFHFSVYTVPAVIREALGAMSLTMDDIDLVVMHQANKTMVDLIYRSLNVPADKRFYFLEEVGNLSGASTPAVLAEAWRQGRLRPGTRTLIASFGVGLSWGVAVIQWPSSIPPPVARSIEYEEAR